MGLIAHIVAGELDDGEVGAMRDHIGIEARQALDRVLAGHAGVDDGDRDTIGAQPAVQTPRQHRGIGVLFGHVGRAPGDGRAEADDGGALGDGLVAHCRAPAFTAA